MGLAAGLAAASTESGQLHAVPFATDYLLKMRTSDVFKNSSPSQTTYLVCYAEGRH